MAVTPNQGSAQLSDYATLLRRQWWIVLLLIALGVGLAVAYTSTAPREYTSKTSVLVTATGVDEQSASGVRTTNNDINLDTEAQLVTSTEIVAAAAEGIGYTGDTATLADRVSITVPPNTEILEIGYTGATAAEARDGAEAFATAYLDNRRAAAEDTLQATRDSLQSRIDDLTEQLETVSAAIAGLPPGSAERAFNEAQATSLNSQIGSLGTQLNQVGATIVSPGRVITNASLPRAPSSPDLLIDIAAGALIGLLAGVGLAVLRQRSDRVLRRATDVERRAGLPVLVELAGGSTHPVELAAPNTEEGRSYARLRNVVTSSLADTDRVVLVAGVSGPAGPVAANLAASLARSGEEVVLVCGDVHARTASDLLGGRTGTGLAEVLAGRAKLSGARRRVVDPASLRVLGPGRNPEQAAALLQTGSPRQVVEELLTTARWVVVEAPTTTSGADAQTLAALADLAILVIATDQTGAADVADARAQFDSVHTTLLGAVVVRGDRRGGRRPEAVTTPAGATVEAEPAGSTKRPARQRPTPAGTATIEVPTATEAPDAAEDQPDTRPATVPGAGG
ncbi:MAG: lipopolysaccharide biosynthesis protein [Modestobacter sp.]|jgi:capsular polysaccharide biosynthesis protein/Mrp family chromosome partitioning ATPase|nr:lipopolysaccharide biosynthesis protein [Modestobacter sp.]